MTPTISPVTGALPQQPAPTATNCATAPPPLATSAPSPAAAAVPTPQSSQAAVGAAPTTSAPPATTVGGGTVQAAQGAMNVAPEQLVPILQELVAVLTKLVAAIQQQGGVTGGGAPGGAPGQVGQCGMSGCTMNHAAPTQAGAPTQGGAMGGFTPSDADKQQSRNAPRASSPAAGNPAPASAQRVDPGSVKDKTGTGGLTSPSKRGLEEAHTFGLPLVSGKRSGSGTSDHDHGNAIDVGTLPIGSPSSDGGTPQMKAFAEHMRQQGKAGKLDVKYVIADGRIASATNNWEWRAYTYPGKSQGELEALKRSNPGEYNRLQHNDHVHVSFG
jgi:hypothetical protein